MASKQYISIIRLFDHCGISTVDDFNLSRAKKQLQAEFGIAQGGFIEVDGYTYTRHDVFEEIEQPDFPKRLVFHKQIWDSPQILQLLEKNTVDLISVQDEFAPLCGNKEFDEFFSPYLAGPFNYLSRTFLADARLKEMGDLLNYEDFLQPAEREVAFRPLRVFLEENIRILRNVNGENYSMMRPKISHWIERDWYVFFNNLPHEFYDTKNDITVWVINIGVEVQKSHRRDCKRMSEQLIALQDTPESLRTTIVSNHAVYSGSSSWSLSGRNAFWMIWVVFMLIRAISSNGCSESKSSYKEFSYPHLKNKLHFQDSLFRIIKDSSFRFNRDSLLK